MKINTPLLFTAIVIVCIGLLPRAQAVVPAPDGGYPGFNTAEGQKALFSLDVANGFANTAVGWFSLLSNVEGDFNTATGAGALLFNTADNNAAFGAAALLFNTTGGDNTAIGAAALLNNTEGSFNTAVGGTALRQNTDGNLNTAVGQSALQANTSGQENTAVGEGALRANTSGQENTAVGSIALLNTTGADNTACGRAAMVNNTTGNLNTAVGSAALFNSTGSGNIALGADAGLGVSTANDVICIGTTGANVENSCFIGHIRGRQTQNADALPVLIDSAGQLATVNSSRRFKKEIKPMNEASEAIRALKPVTFHYKSDTTGTPQFGLIAEEVAEVNPDLVVRDEKGEIYTVRYEAVNAMLLNEFLKEHHKVQEQQKQIDSLKTELKEQRDLIQKVSAKVETMEPAGLVTKNP